MRRSVVPKNFRRQKSLSPEWQTFIARLEGKISKNSLKRAMTLIRFVNYLRNQPHSVETTVFDYFVARYQRLLGPERANATLREIFCAWEILRRRSDSFLTPIPTNLFQPRFLNPSLADMPISLQRDISAHLATVRSRNAPRATNPVRGKAENQSPARQATLRFIRDLIRGAVGAQVRAGHDIVSLTSLTQLVCSTAIRTTIADRQFRRQLRADPAQRNDPRALYTDSEITRQLVSIAMASCNPTAKEIDQLRTLLKLNPWRPYYNRLFPPAAVSNQLRQFNDPTTLQRWTDLHRTLARRAELSVADTGTITRSAIGDVEVALMVSLLREVPIRALTLSKLRIAGDRPNLVGDIAPVLIIYPEDNKNYKKMRIRLSTRSASILALYVYKYRPMMSQLMSSSTNNDFLFAGHDIKSRTPASLLAAWKKRHLEVGINLSIQMSRHLAAKLMRKNAEGSPTQIRALLGHRSLRTTFRYYLGDDLHAASGHLHSLLPVPQLNLPVYEVSDQKIYEEIGGLTAPHPLTLLEFPRYKKTSQGYRVYVVRCLKQLLKFIKQGKSDTFFKPDILQEFVDSRTHLKPVSIIMELRNLTGIIGELCSKETGAVFGIFARKIIIQIRLSRGEATSDLKSSFGSQKSGINGRDYAEWEVALARLKERTVPRQFKIISLRLTRSLERLAKYVINADIPLISEINILIFIKSIRNRGLRQATVVTYLQEMLSSARLLYPGTELSWLELLVAKNRQDLKICSEPVGRSVALSTSDFVALGAELIEAAEQQHDRYHKAAAKYRDGLMMLLLVSVPLRLDGIHKLLISDINHDTDAGTILVRIDTYVGPHVSSFSLWAPLVSVIRRYLRIFRPMLMPPGENDFLWVSARGRRMSRSGISHALRVRSRDRFGFSVTADRLREIVANTIIEQTPEQFLHATSILRLHGVESMLRHAEQAELQLAHRLAVEM